jgi:hypothetical protein
MGKGRICVKGGAGSVRILHRTLGRRAGVGPLSGVIMAAKKGRRLSGVTAPAAAGANARLRVGDEWDGEY